MVAIDYTSLNYEHKLLYMRSVFEASRNTHSVYQKLYTLLTGKRTIPEKHLDMLYEQVQSVVDSSETEEIIAKLGELAAKLDRIRKMEAIDRQNEQADIKKLEEKIMRLDDDKPSFLH